MEKIKEKRAERQRIIGQLSVAKLLFKVVAFYFCFQYNFTGRYVVMNFADKLYHLRIKYGYSQEALAEKLKVSRQAISKWELGTALPETEKVIAISDFFNVSIDYLLKDNIQLNNNESLDRIVLRFLGSAQNMDDISRELVDIMQDGIIDDNERVRMDAIIDTLDTIADIIDEIKQKMNIK